MYRYDSHDHRFVAERVAQFRDQTRRFLAGELTEDEFRPLRLQTAVHPEVRADAAGRHLRPAVIDPVAQAGTSDASMTEATATHHAPEHPARPRRDSKMCRDPWPAGSRMPRSRPAGNCVRNIRRPLCRRSRTNRRSRAYCGCSASGRRSTIRVPAAQFGSRCAGRRLTVRATLVHIGVHAVRAAGGRFPRAGGGGGLGRR